MLLWRVQHVDTDSRQHCSYLMHSLQLCNLLQHQFPPPQPAVFLWNYWQMSKPLKSWPYVIRLLLRFFSCHSRLSLHPADLCVSVVCIHVFVHILGSNTRPWRVFYHWRLCASSSGEPATPTHLIRSHLPHVALNVDLDPNMTWRHVKTENPPHFHIVSHMCYSALTLVASNVYV